MFSSILKLDFKSITDMICVNEYNVLNEVNNKGTRGRKGILFI